jgi:hypothetical protein
MAAQKTGFILFILFDTQCPRVYVQPDEWPRAEAWIVAFEDRLVLIYPFHCFINKEAECPRTGTRCVKYLGCVLGVCTTRIRVLNGSPRTSHSHYAAVDEDVKCVHLIHKCFQNTHLICSGYCWPMRAPKTGLQISNVWEQSYSIPNVT